MGVVDIGTPMYVVTMVGVGNDCELVDDDDGNGDDDATVTVVVTVVFRDRGQQIMGR